MDVLHTAIRVSDLESTIEFYEEELGLSHSWDFVRDGATNYYVTGDGSDTEIQFVYDPDGDDSVEPSGIDHIAVSVDDLEATFERLVEETVSEPVEEPQYVAVPDATIAFVTDPDGYVIELVEPGE